MPSNITVTVHVKPHIKNYLISVSKNKAEPIRFPKRHHFTDVLLPLLTTKSKYQILKHTETDINRPSESVKIMLPFQYTGIPNIRYRNQLSPTCEHEFRLCVERFHKMKLNEFVTKKILKGHSRIDALNMFISEMMTDKGVNIETHYRGYSRLKKVLC